MHHDEWLSILQQTIYQYHLHTSIGFRKQEIRIIIVLQTVLAPNIELGDSA